MQAVQRVSGLCRMLVTEALGEFSSRECSQLGVTCLRGDKVWKRFWLQPGNGDALGVW